MDIIGKLKKEKKLETVFDSIIKKKETKESQPKPADIEVTSISSDKAPATEVPQEKKESPSKREFRTEGMHEFDMESLGLADDAGVKIEYKAKVSTLIDAGKIDEAINLLKELKERLTQK